MVLLPEVLYLLRSVPSNVLALCGVHLLRCLLSAVLTLTFFFIARKGTAVARYHKSNHNTPTRRYSRYQHQYARIRCMYQVRVGVSLNTRKLHEHEEHEEEKTNTV